MFIFLLFLVIVFGFYYLLNINSLFLADGTWKVPTILYLIIFGIMFWIYYKTPTLEYNSIENIVSISCTGFVVYVWLASRAFWLKPKRYKLHQLIHKESPTEEDEEEIENIILSHGIGKVKGLTCLLMAAICLFIGVKRTLPDVTDQLIGLIGVAIFLCFFAVIIYLIIDLVLFAKRNVFAFYTLRPLVVFISLIVLLFIL